MRQFSRPGVRHLAALFLILLVAAMPGCRKKTPEQRLQEAQQLVQERQIPMAMIRLRDLVADSPESEAALGARFMLAQLYTEYRNEEYYRRALEEVEAIYKQVGLNDYRGFEAYSMATDIMLTMGQLDEALAHLQAGMEKATDVDVKERLGLMEAGLRLTFDDEEIRQPGIDRFLDVMMHSEEPGLRGQAREILARFYGDKEQYEQANAVYQQYIDAFPEDTVLPQLEIAQALNYQRLEDNEMAEIMFASGAGAMNAQIEEELNLEVRARLLTDLALYYAAFGDIDSAVDLLRRVMAENVRTMTAIQAQFRIGELYTRSRDNWERAIEHFEKMAVENANTSIGEQAANAVTTIRQRIAQIAEAEAAASEALTIDVPQIGEGADVEPEVDAAP